MPTDTVATIVVALSTLYAFVVLLATIGARTRAGVIARSFALQEAIVGLMGGSILALSGFNIVALLLLFLGCTLLYIVVSPATQRLRTISDHQSLLSVYSANVEGTNLDSHTVATSIIHHDCDVVILIESNPELHNKLSETLRIRYRYSHHHVYRGSIYGVSIFSKLVPTSEEVTNDQMWTGPPYRATLAVHGLTMTLVVVHPLTPERAVWFEHRNTYFEDICAFVSLTGNHTVVIGDFNATGWDPYFRRMLKRSGLIDGRGWREYVGTWPTWFPLLQIPLDHVLTTPDLLTREFRRGQQSGSDHWPVVADIAARNKGA